MAKKWPRYITRDLGDSAKDAAEMLRRWKIYDKQMKALIAKGGVHQDEDGWWVDDKTGDLIGPDPDIERPLTAKKIAKAKPFAEAFPDFAAGIKRARGRPKVEAPKEAVTLRVHPSTVEKFKLKGDDWRTRMAKVLEKAKV